MIALIGVDPLTGTPRLSFEQPVLMKGIDFIPVVIGVFGIAEVLASLERIENVRPIRTRLRDMWLTAADWSKCRFSILRGGFIGLFVGIMPGAGASIASLLAYLTERKFSSTPETFGKGAIDGVAAAEAANNAASHGAAIPMLSLGIPGSASTAILLAALILHGIRPGPQLMTQESALVWGLIASMFIGNLFLLILNLPLAPAFAGLLRIPYVYIAPAILGISLVGAYAATLDMATVWMSLGFGLLGYAMIKFDIPRPPLVLALVLASLMEMSLRQALLLSFGSPMIFVERPISAILLALVVLAVVLPVASAVRRRKVATATPRPAPDA
jgi:putative tricarboxylic transport membrane protein